VALVRGQVRCQGLQRLGRQGQHAGVVDLAECPLTPVAVD
jgi:hypothetical protein